MLQICHHFKAQHKRTGVCQGLQWSCDLFPMASHIGVEFWISISKLPKHVSLKLKLYQLSYTFGRKILCLPPTFTPYTPPITFFTRDAHAHGHMMISVPCPTWSPRVLERDQSVPRPAGPACVAHVNSMRWDRALKNLVSMKVCIVRCSIIHYARLVYT